MESPLGHGGPAPAHLVRPRQPPGAVILSLLLPTQLKKAKTTPYYMAEKALADPPENAPSVHAIGYSMHSFGEVFMSKGDVARVKHPLSILSPTSSSADSRRELQ